MIPITPKVLKFILIGIYLLGLYYQSRFKGFIGIAIVCFMVAALKFIMPDKIILVFLIGIVSWIIAIGLSLKELKKYKNAGIEIFRFGNKNIVFGFFLFLVYVLAKIFFFDKQ